MVKKKLPMKDVRIFSKPLKGTLTLDFHLGEVEEDGRSDYEDAAHFKKGCLLVIIGEYSKLLDGRYYQKQYICIAPDCAETTNISEAHIILEEEE
jgi:hypothetical protein